MPPTLQSLGIDRLSAEDRIALAQQIWDSIEAESHHSFLTDAKREELARHIADLAGAARG